MSTITSKTIDLPRLTAAICALPPEIRAVKALLRESGQPAVSWHTYKSLRELKRRATLLCALRAHLRGRVHLKSMDAPKQAEYIQKAAAEFSRPIVPCSTSESPSCSIPT